MAFRSDTRKLIAATERYGTPVYVYEERAVLDACRALRRAFKGIDIAYAMKANANPTLLSLIKKEGFLVETVSVGELGLAKEVGWREGEITYTSSSVTEKELKQVAAAGARVHLDSLQQLELWGKRRLSQQVSIRINQGIGVGHHAHVVTGGPKSKFGITPKDIPQAKEIAARYNLSITGIHQHVGSNALDEKILLKAADALLATARTLPDVTHIDFGGGIGVAYKSGDENLSLTRYGQGLRDKLKAFQLETKRKLQASIEPGRYVVAEAGSLLVEVVDKKETKSEVFVGVNSGFSHLIRPAMYGSYHPVQNLSRPRGKKETVSLAGNICESGDVFAWRRDIPEPLIGDVLAIGMAGAYGFSMASPYNLRALPREVLITSSGKIKDISFSPWLYAH